MADFSGFDEVVKFFTKTFGPTDLPLVVRHSIVGGTIITATVATVGAIVRPRGTLYWHRSQARTLVAEAQQISGRASTAEGQRDALKSYLERLIGAPQKLQQTQPLPPPMQPSPQMPVMPTPSPPAAPTARLPP